MLLLIETVYFPISVSCKSGRTVTVAGHKVLSWILEESVVEATWEKEYEVMHWP